MCAPQVSICTEVPAFSMQGAIQSRVSSSVLLNIVLAATVLRLGCYALLPLAGMPWAVLPVELLHGLTFGVGWSTAVATAAKLAPLHLSATMQASGGGAAAGCVCMHFAPAVAADLPVSAALRCVLLAAASTQGLFQATYGGVGAGLGGLVGGLLLERHGGQGLFAAAAGLVAAGALLGALAEHATCSQPAAAAKRE